MWKEAVRSLEELALEKSPISHSQHKFLHMIKEGSLIGEERKDHSQLTVMQTNPVRASLQAYTKINSTLKD